MFPLGSWLSDWFGFPNGAVLTNLVASAICVGVGIWRLRKTVHQKLEEMHNHIRDIHKHHGLDG